MPSRLGGARFALVPPFLLALAALALASPTVAAATVPAIEPLPPGQIRNNEAIVRFAINPEGLKTTYGLEYGPTAAYVNRAMFYPGELAAGNQFVSLQQRIGWTTPYDDWPFGAVEASTEYHYRVTAENADGTTLGPDQTFTTTDGPAPQAVTGEATYETPTAVTLHGTVNPEGVALTQCRFHYLQESIYWVKGFRYGELDYEPIGFFVPCAETSAQIGSGDQPVPVHANLSGLSSESYAFRLEAENKYTYAEMSKQASQFEIPGQVESSEVDVQQPSGSDPPHGEFVAPEAGATQQRRRHHRHRHGHHRHRYGLSHTQQQG